MNPPPPVASLILHFLSSEAYLAEVIESVLWQTHNAWELILVDGGSMDSTPGVVRKYTSLHPGRIKSYRHDAAEILGIYSSRIRGAAREVRGARARIGESDRRIRRSFGDRLVDVWDGVGLDRCQGLFRSRKCSPHLWIVRVGTEQWMQLVEHSPSRLGRTVLFKGTMQELEGSATEDEALTLSDVAECSGDLLCDVGVLSRPDPKCRPIEPSAVVLGVEPQGLVERVLGAVLAPALL